MTKKDKRSEKVGESLRVSRSSSWVRQESQLKTPPPERCEPMYHDPCPLSLQDLEHRIVDLLDKRLGICV